jgi:hypothetical protein
MMKRTVRYLIAILLSMLLVSCGGGQTVNTLTPVLETSDTPTLEIMATVSPTPTETPQRMVLLAGEGWDAALLGMLQARLQELSTQSGLVYEGRTSLTLAELQPGDIRIVVAMAPMENLVELVASAPQTQFLAIGFNQLEPAANLHVIELKNSQPGMDAFMAGYIATIITPDWRVGVFSDADSPEGVTDRVGFQNGVYYYCGLCRSVYPPYPVPGYPLYWETTVNAGQVAWDAGIAYFQDWQVKTVYIGKGLESDEFLQYLAQAGFNLIAGRQAPQGLQQNWVASLVSGELDLILNDLWERMLVGENGVRESLSLEVADVNAGLFSPGRQALVNQVLSDLQDGFIGTGVSP